jgi:hypothetical protein
MSKLIVEAEMEVLRAEKAMLLAFARRVRARSKPGRRLQEALPNFVTIHEDALEVLARFEEKE